VVRPDLINDIFLEKIMWKIAVGFAIFAGLALYVISKGGDSLDMSGEKHGADAVHAPAPAAPAPAEAPAATAPAAAPAAPAAPAPAAK
jgi:pyruvate/2-oxoglutarate dehydrogenase complex dihydrolipoamide acyltransferase (E2) component